MSWGWLPTVASTIFGIFETAAVAGVGMVCPPLAPVVGMALTITGSVVQDSIEDAVDGMQPNKGGPANLPGFSDEQMKELTSQLGSITNVVEQNQMLLTENQKHILKNQDYIKKNNKMLEDVKKFLHSNAAETRKSMKEMKESLKSFDENMQRNFDELKDFIIEVDFLKNIREPIHLLWEAMEAACTSQSKSVTQNFLDRYILKKPRLILGDFIESLKHPNRNPISSAMSNNILKSRDILNNYMQLLSHMIVKIVAVEGFYYGLTAKNDKNSKKDYEDFMLHLSNDINSAVTSIRDFITTFKFPTEKYWPGLVNKTTTSINVGSDTVEIADKIKKGLDGIYTKDVYTIYVYRCGAANPCFPSPLIVSAEPSKHLMAGGVNDATKVIALVLRSETYHNVPAVDTREVQNIYRSGLASRNLNGQAACDHISKVLFGYQLKTLFDSKERMYGFVACDVKGPIEERLTNNGKPLFSSEDRNLLKDNKVFPGVSWV